MNYKLVNEKITENYAQNLLRIRGIQDYERYMSSNIEDIAEPTMLDYISEGAKLLIKQLEAKNKIYFVVDCDVDGYTSSAILWNAIKVEYPDADLNFIIHDGKQHGLSDCINFFENTNEEINLVILPDSSSNDYNCHKRLAEIGTKVLVLDHHDADKYSEDAIVINNQLSERYKNKQLTGAGVVWQFCRYLYQKYDWHNPCIYTDLAAFGIISDMGKVIGLENHAIVEKGINYLYNPFFKGLIKSQSFFLKDKFCPHQVAMMITPSINAAIRVGSQEQKEQLFLAFIDDGTTLIPSTKRGEKGMEELLITQVIRNCTNLRNKQNSTKEDVVAHLEAKIQKENLLDNKVLFITLTDEDDFPAVFNGSTLLAR